MFLKVYGILTAIGAIVFEHIGQNAVYPSYSQHIGVLSAEIPT